MKKSDVVTALNKVRDASRKWNTARAKYKGDESMVMRRLAMEGAANYMSPDEIANEAGMTERAVRLILRAEGLDPRRSRPVLAKHAARTLADNAALLGVEPTDVDLMSPLAYLPVGSNLKQFMGASVTADEIEDVASALATGTWCTECQVFEPEGAFVSGDCGGTGGCGCNQVKHLRVSVVAA